MFSCNNEFITQVGEKRLNVRIAELFMAFHNTLKKFNDTEASMLDSIWALTQENLSSEVCEQHRRRPACASFQSDQRLSCLLFGKYHMLTCNRLLNFNFLAGLCS